ncbi:MAG: transcription antitermination factor NusB [Clostridia bacterium]|nr:transcription antitermination factor NusB [Clostridia bacterium]
MLFYAADAEFVPPNFMGILDTPQNIWYNIDIWNLLETITLISGYGLINGATMTRRQAREIIFSLIYEADFHKDVSFAQIYNNAIEDLEFDENDYVRRTFFGMEEKLPMLDTLISEYAVGWKMERLSKVSHAIMRLCIYEMLYSEDVPASVAINEAMELAKTYDHDKAPAFINGVVNAIAKNKGLIQNDEA